MILYRSNQVMSGNVLAVGKTTSLKMFDAVSDSDLINRGSVHRVSGAHVQEAMCMPVMGAAATTLCMFTRDGRASDVALDGCDCDIGVMYGSRVEVAGSSLQMTG